MAKKRPARPRFVAVHELLRSHAVLKQSLERQRRDQGVAARVADALFAQARPHCLDARVADGVLTLTMDSPAWATRARYRAPDLLAELKDLNLSEVRIRTRPPAPQDPPRSSARLPRLAPSVVAHLLAAAEGCADPAIGEVFRRLAHRQGAGAGGGGGPSV